jgi:hypothetical protein
MIPPIPPPIFYHKGIEINRNYLALPATPPRKISLKIDYRPKAGLPVPDVWVKAILRENRHPPFFFVGIP